MSTQIELAVVMSSVGCQVSGVSVVVVLKVEVLEVKLNSISFKFCLSLQLALHHHQQHSPEFMASPQRE